MTYRDSFDQCPRCGVTLDDAQDARGCRECGGRFVEEPVLAEMLLRMLPPPPRLVGALALSEVAREGKALACPSCGEAMKPTTIVGVELDRCTKHGVWFDEDELRIALYRTGLPGNAVPFLAWIPSPEPPPMKRPPAPRIEPNIDPNARRIVFEVAGERIAVQTGVIKIGRGLTSTLRIDDEAVSRMHAVIEATAKEVIVIDLGTEIGTYLNGERVSKWALKSGDVLRFGTTDVTIFI